MTEYNDLITEYNDLKKKEIIELVSELNSDDVLEIYNYLQPKLNFKSSLQNSKLFESSKWFINETNKDIITDILDNQKKDAELLEDPNYDLKYRSRYFNRNIFKSNIFYIYGSNNQSLYMSDYIMFNKFNIPFNKLERYISFCKIKYHSENKFQIDGWIIEQDDYDYKNTKILYDDSNLDELKLCANDSEYYDVIKNLKIIMDFTPTECINYHNYYVLNEWCVQNYSFISKASNELLIKDKDINYDLADNDLHINIHKRLSLDDLFKILYTNSINGISDLYEMFGYYENEPLKYIQNHTLIQEYKNSPIYVVINNESIDLKKYLKFNGVKRTYRCIKNINDELKNKYYCENISKEELLCELYNSQTPFGMGIFQSCDKTLTIEDTTKILSNNNFVDYLHGVAIKINFSNFPIINYEKFESRNGTGTFLKCIINIKNKNFSKKEPITLDKIIKNIDLISKPLDMS
jgi:hypothetical protein